MEHILNFWTVILNFLSTYGIHSLLGFSIIGNIYLIIAWVKRERYIEMTEIEVSLFKPRIKFELNKDEKYRFMANEIIRLKNELEVLKKETDKPWIIVFVMILFAVIIGTIIAQTEKVKNKFKPDNTDTKEENSTEELNPKTEKNNSEEDEEINPKDFLEQLEKELKKEKIKKEDT